MVKILAVALGGAIGSTGRYLTSLAVESFSDSNFPYETLAANLIGCFVIGLLWGYFERMSKTCSGVLLKPGVFLKASPIRLRLI